MAKHIAADSTRVVNEGDAMTDVSEQYHMSESVAWLRAAAIRAIKTGAQSLLGFLSAGAIFSDIDWRVSLSAAGLAMLASVLTSIVGVPEVASGADVSRLDKPTS